MLQAQDHRNVDALCTHLQDSIWQIRRAAALAFASVRSGEAVPCLQPALRDRKAAVRAAAAFAMGLCGNVDEAEEMVDMLRFEHEAVVRYALWEGAGRIGDELTLNRLLYQQTKDQQDSLGLAWALYAMALDGFANDTSVHKCLELLLSDDVAIRLGAAHALGRTKSVLLAPHKKNIAKWMGLEPLTEVRLALLRAYGQVIETDDLPILHGQFAKANPLEQVTILRCLSGLSDPASNLFLQNACNAENYQVAMAAVTVLTNRSDFNYIKIPLGSIAKNTPVEEAGLRLIIACVRAMPQKKAQGFSLLADRYQHSTNPYIRAYSKILLLETGFNPINDMTQMALSDSSSMIEKTAATQALFNRFEQHPESGIKDLLALSKLLTSNDPGVLADVATFITSRAHLKGNDQYGLTKSVKAATLSLGELADLEARHTLENAIAHLQGESVAEHIPIPFNHPIDRAKLNALPNEQIYTIKTTKGVIKLITFVDEAPGTCLAFDSLVTAGYYDGKYFHRVVPNFVAQGGCPRGDGYGSMNWTLRTEIGLSRYTTGSVGVASIGADTESCQFFLTHSPTPHLDTRYTRFAQVVEGMEVVNALQVGDNMESIKRTGP